MKLVEGGGILAEFGWVESSDCPFRVRPTRNMALHLARPRNIEASFTPDQKTAWEPYTKLFGAVPGNHLEFSAAEVLVRHQL